MGNSKQAKPVRLTDYFMPLATFIVSWAVGAGLYTRMPASVPVHWGLNGEADRYGSRFEAAFLIPIVITLLIILFHFVSRANNGRAMLRVAGLTGVFLIAIQVIIGLNALGVLLDVVKLVLLSMAALFVGLGFIIPSLSQNRFGGFRNKYTLSDMRVWESTNRLGGRMMMLSGLLIVPLAFAPPLYSFVGMLAVIMICVVLIPIVHSMTEYRRLRTHSG